MDRQNIRAVIGLVITVCVFVLIILILLHYQIIGSEWGLAPLISIVLTGLIVRICLEKRRVKNVERNHEDNRTSTGDSRFYENEMDLASRNETQEQAQAAGNDNEDDLPPPYDQVQHIERLQLPTYSQISGGFNKP